MPSRCPCRVARGSEVLDRKSQSLITGFLSSPPAVTKCNPWSGFQAISETEHPEGSLNSHQAFFWRKSHTIVEPFCAEDARICATWEFHRTLVMSAVCLALLGGGAGTNTLGVSGRSRASTYTSPSLPPEASKCEDSE